MSRFREELESISIDDIALTDALELAEPSSLPPDSDAMVVKTVRVPREVDRAIAEAAAHAGISPSAWIRRAIESMLAGRDTGDLVNVEDVVRAVQGLPRASI